MPPVLPPDLVATMVRGMSVIVGSRDASLRPSIMRAVGSRVEDQGRSITVYLARRQSGQLLQDLAAGGPVAVVFSEPSTHRSVQLKAARVQMRPAGEQDAPVLAAYLAAMEDEIRRVGFRPAITRAMLGHRIEDVVAVQFTPEQAFEQTPGPRAGAALGTGA